MAKIPKYFSLAYKTFQPALVVLAVILILQTSLLIYERLEKNKESQLREEMSKNFGVITDCKRLISPGESTDLKFEFENKNNQPVSLVSINVDVNLTGTQGRTFAKIVKTTPAFKTISQTDKQFTTLLFEDTAVAANSKKEISLTLQATSRSEAGASANTIVGYTGAVLFDFAHDIQTKPSCTLQVRYAP